MLVAYARLEALSNWDCFSHDAPASGARNRPPRRTQLVCTWRRRKYVYLVQARKSLFFLFDQLLGIALAWTRVSLFFDLDCAGSRPNYKFATIVSSVVTALPFWNHSWSLAVEQSLPCAQWDHERLFGVSDCSQCVEMRIVFRQPNRGKLSLSAWQHTDLEKKLCPVSASVVIRKLHDRGSRSTLYIRDQVGITDVLSVEVTH